MSGRSLSGPSLRDRALNRTTQTIEAYGTPIQRSNSTGYDAADNVLTQTDASGFATTFAMGALNRVIGTLDSQGHCATSVYDAASNVVNSIDANNDKTTCADEALNQTTKTTGSRTAA